jgi:hypothetical protein
LSADGGKAASPGFLRVGDRKQRSCHRHGSLRCDNAAKFRDPLAGPGAVASGARHIPPRLSGYRKRLVALSFGHEISVPRVAPGARSKREWGAATGVGMLV